MLALGNTPLRGLLISYHWSFEEHSSEFALKFHNSGVPVILFRTPPEGGFFMCKEF